MSSPSENNDQYQYPTDLAVPGGGNRVLMHSCCAPCVIEQMAAMTAAGIEYTIFFYNPNIHPTEEYEIRKEENIRYCEQQNPICRCRLRCRQLVCQNQRHGVGARAR